MSHKSVQTLANIVPSSLGLRLETWSQLTLQWTAGIVLATTAPAPSKVLHSRLGPRGFGVEALLVFVSARGCVCVSVWRLQVKRCDEQGNQLARSEAQIPLQLQVMRKCPVYSRVLLLSINHLMTPEGNKPHSRATGLCTISLHICCSVAVAVRF